MYFPSALLVGIEGFVRIFLKSVEDIFVAGLAGLRADVGFGPVGQVPRRAAGGFAFCPAFAGSCFLPADCAKTMSRISTSAIAT